MTEIYTESRNGSLTAYFKELPSNDPYAPLAMELGLYDPTQDIWLDTIIVLKQSRRHGEGSFLLKELLTLAESMQTRPRKIITVITPQIQFFAPNGIPKESLIEFYSKSGFSYTDIEKLGTVVEYIF